MTLTDPPERDGYDNLGSISTVGIPASELSEAEIPNFGEIPEQVALWPDPKASSLMSEVEIICPHP